MGGSVVRVGTLGWRNEFIGRRGSDLDRCCEFSLAGGVSVGLAVTVIVTVAVSCRRSCFCQY